MHSSNVFALNIHREHSETYTKELNNKNINYDDDDDDLLKNLPVLPFKSSSSDNGNAPIFTPGATFMLPNKEE